jgi:hopanoid biosynthesis associated RND transporter like protein HpnN
MTASRSGNNLFVKTLSELIGVISSRSGFFIIPFIIITVFFAFFAAVNFRVNSSRGELIDPDAPFRKPFEVFQEAFPVYKQVILVAVEAETGQAAADAAVALHDKLVERRDIFVSVFAPAAEPFFRDHGLLYLDTEDLEDVVDQLANAQPALTALAQDPSLNGLFSLLESALEAYKRGEKLPSSFAQLMDRISDTGEAALLGIEGELTWDDVVARGEGGPKIQIISIQIREDFSELLSARDAIETIRQAAFDVGLTEENGISVMLTGNIPLAFEEMQAVGASIGLAGVLSFVLIALILGFGIRSLRIIVAILLTLSIGLVWTVAWAMFSVGEFNMLSASFAVLFIGLGVDYAIHFSLRYQQALEEGDDHVLALKTAGLSVGGAVSLCALTSAIGFFSFIPTGYRGVAALGIISGGGMVLAVIASLTVMPVLLALMGGQKRQAGQVSFARAGQGLNRTVRKNANAITALAMILAVGSIGIATQSTFDFSTLTLKDQDSESITTLKKLQDEGIVTDYSVLLLADDLNAVPKIQKRLLELPTIREVQTPQDFLPSDQDYKLQLLEEAYFLLLPAFTAEPESLVLTLQERFATVSNVKLALTNAEFDQDGDKELRQSADRLAQTLSRLIEAEDRDRLLQDLEERLTANSSDPIEYLRTALQVEYVTIEKLPESVYSRVISADGRVQIVGLPFEDLTNFEAMERFVDNVTIAFPEATGRPILEAGVGDIVVESFQIALGIAISAIVIVLLIAVRHVSDTVFILFLLLLAISLATATGVLAGIPFNQANIIVLPLIVGLGVHNGIHMVMRFREDGSLEKLMSSSTPRAVILSTLTTVAAFGALAISIHQGIQSMGQLLAISMIYLLIATIIVLPALLYWREGLGSGR